MVLMKINLFGIFSELIENCSWILWYSKYFIAILTCNLFILMFMMVFICDGRLFFIEFDDYDTQALSGPVGVNRAHFN